MEKCNIKNNCGGCNYQGIEYKKQLKIKEKEVNKLLGKFGKIDKIIGMENPIYYRNKVHHAFYSDRKGNIISGIYEPNSHKVLDPNICLLEDEQSQMIIKSITKLIKSFNLNIYNEKTKEGLFRRVLIRRGFKTNQIMVVLIISNPIFPSKANFIKELLKIHPEITTIVLNINNKHTSMILGDKFDVIYGNGYIEDILCDLKFRISPSSFYQVNPIQTEKLYSLAISYAKIENEIVLDAYCGIGTIGLIASKQAKQVIGVEINKEAISDAKINAKINNINNIKFYAKDASTFITTFKDKIDTLIMDPPRNGSTNIFLKSILNLQPKKIVYISCNPITLSKDLNIVTKKYCVKKIQPVDMFPYTAHVETVVLMSRA